MTQVTKTNLLSPIDIERSIIKLNKEITYLKWAYPIAIATVAASVAICAAAFFTGGLLVIFSGTLFGVFVSIDAVTLIAGVAGSLALCLAKQIKNREQFSQNTLSKLSKGNEEGPPLQMTDKILPEEPTKKALEAAAQILLDLPRSESLVFNEIQIKYDTQDLMIGEKKFDLKNGNLATKLVEFYQAEVKKMFSNLDETQQLELVVALLVESHQNAAFYLANEAYNQFAPTSDVTQFAKTTDVTKTVIPEFPGPLSVRITISSTGEITHYCQKSMKIHRFNSETNSDKFDENGYDCTSTMTYNFQTKKFNESKVTFTQKQLLDDEVVQSKKLRSPNTSSI